LWRYQNMRCEVPSQEWFSPSAFWDLLDKENYRVALVDIPTVLGAHKLKNGIHLVGWGSHDLFLRESWPEKLWQKLEKKFGKPVTCSEHFGPQSAKSLLDLRSNLIKASEQMLKISSELFSMQPWDLFFVVFGAPHRAGHYLWDLSQVDLTGVAADKIRLLKYALVDVYRTCDQALSQLIEKVPSDTRILVFATHGVDRNQGWSDYCSKILAKIQEVSSGFVPKEGFLYKMKQILPWQFIRQVTTRIPQHLANRLVEYWSAKMFDWRTTRYFPLPMDHAGYIRINLKGRESLGIVQGYQEFETLCQDLEEAFRSFRDIDTGEPIVENVYTVDDLAPLDAPFRQNLPDLIVTWRRSAIDSKGIYSEKYGKISLDNIGKLPSGRSGNHCDRGWFIATGNGIPNATLKESYHAVDLVPTVFDWLGASIAEDFQGSPIRALCVNE
jgi:predicted AlkP superfamily phosphohydrolase/phosphomutase